MLAPWTRIGSSTNLVTTKHVTTNTTMRNSVNCGLRPMRIMRSHDGCGDASAFIAIPNSRIKPEIRPKFRESCPISKQRVKPKTEEVARQNSSLPHECGVPGQGGTLHLCGRPGAR